MTSSISDQMLGHSSLSAMQKYLGVNYADARAAVAAIALIIESDRTKRSGSPKLIGSELKTTADETLFLELALRKYDLSRLREGTGADTSVDIVKIG